jgi:S-adenosylmethionine:tRNA ribosyltransferase-isomerase
LNTHATNTSITSIANHVNQWEDASCSAKEAYALLRDYTKKNVKSGIDATTQLCISPGFDIDTIDALLTNFHVPKSTLLALVASCIGPDWKRVYEYAMHNDFRFLSYGDSSLLFLPQKTRQ